MSSKKTYYFQHDCNAREDDKIIALRMDKGAAGYGTYFLLLEFLSTSPDCMFERNYNKIGFILHLSSDEIKAVVENYGLFQFTDDGKQFYSVRLKEHMDVMHGLSEARSIAGRKGGAKKAENSKIVASANQNCSKIVASANQICSRGEDIREEESKGEKKREKTPGGVNARTRVEQAADGDGLATEVLEVEVLPEKSLLRKEEQERQFQVGIMQGWQQHYRQTFGTDYLLTRGSITNEVADIAPAVERLMQQYGQDTADTAQVQDFSAQLFSAMYSHADQWQRQNWSIRIIKRQFNDLLKPIINGDENNGNSNAARSTNARDDNEYLASLVAELRACQNQ